MQSPGLHQIVRIELARRWGSKYKGHFKHITVDVVETAWLKDQKLITAAAFAKNVAVVIANTMLDFKLSNSNYSQL